MPIGLHLTLTLVLEFGGGVALLFFAVFHREYVEALGINRNLAAVAGLILGGSVPRLVMQFLVPAKCPRCAGRSFLHGGRPITYHCRGCGHVHTTSISDGGVVYSGRSSGPTTDGQGDPRSSRTVTVSGSTKRVVKQRIVINGVEYSDPKEVPPEFAHLLTDRDGNDVTTERVERQQKYIVNGKEYGSLEELPAHIRRTLEDLHTADDDGVDGTQQ